VITPYTIAKTWIGTKEIKGVMDNPLIMAMLTMDNSWPQHDEVPWCSAFINFIARQCGLPRSKSLLARSWLGIGDTVPLDRAAQGFDLAILSRGENAPGPGNHTAPGHVGFYSYHFKDDLFLLGGNQSDSVSIDKYPTARLLGVRRI
jgi:uncharacterized protein (TIGR02594 family)